MLSTQNLKNTEKYSEENKQLRIITINMFCVSLFFQGFMSVLLNTWPLSVETPLMLISKHRLSPMSQRSLM